MISRKEQSLKAIIPNVDNSEEFQNMVSLVYKKGAYWTFHSKSLLDDSFKNHADRVWKIVKFESYQNKKQNKCHVVEGDVIKFGRVRFRIKKLVIDQDHIESNEDEGPTLNLQQNSMSRNRGLNVETSVNNHLRPVQTSIEMDNNTLQNNTLSEADTRNTVMMTRNAEQLEFDNKPIEFQNDKQNEQEQLMKSQMSSLMKQKSGVDGLICRICLSEEEPENILISPCNCTGSMKHIHLECLREWLEGKKHCKLTPFVNSYIWKNLECEICKCNYPDSITLKDGSECSLLNYKVHESAKSYMIINSVTNTTSLTIHVVNFSAKRDIKVGRGQNAEVRITDISVSRFHSLIKLNKKGQLFVSDNQSKFGTLVQLNGPIMIKPLETLYFQVGRAVLVLYITNRYSCFERCCLFGTSKKKKDNALHYDEVEKFFPLEFQEYFSIYYPSPRKISARQVNVMVDRNLNNQNIDSRNRQNRDLHESFSPTSLNIPLRQAPLRLGQRHPSVAAEFVTDPQPLDSENNLGQPRRSQEINNLSAQLHNRVRQNPQRYESQDELLVGEIDLSRHHSSMGLQFEQHRSTRLAVLEHVEEEKYAQDRRANDDDDSDEDEDEREEEELKYSEHGAEERKEPLPYEVTPVQRFGVNENQHSPIHIQDDEQSFDIPVQGRKRDRNSVHDQLPKQNTFNGSIFDISKGDVTQQNFDSRQPNEEIKIRDLEEEEEQKTRNKSRHQSMFKEFQRSINQTPSVNQAQGPHVFTTIDPNTPSVNVPATYNMNMVNYENIIPVGSLDEKEKPGVEESKEQEKQKQMHKVKTSRDSRDFRNQNLIQNQPNPYQ